MAKMENCDVSVIVFKCSLRLVYAAVHVMFVCLMSSSFSESCMAAALEIFFVHMHVLLYVCSPKILLIGQTLDNLCFCHCSEVNFVTIKS